MKKPRLTIVTAVVAALLVITLISQKNTSPHDVDSANIPHQKERRGDNGGDDGGDYPPH